VSWADRLDRTLATAASKREAAEALGVHAGTVRSHIDRQRPELMGRWSALPAGGAFAGRGGLPMVRPGQSDADALVHEASSMSPLNPSSTQRHNLVRLLLAMYAINGSMAYSLGWVRSVLLAFEAAGCRAPTPASVRWYRCRLQSEPDTFAAHAGGFEGEMERLADRAYG